MKTVKIVGIVATMLISILALGSCSTDKSVPETKQEFWAEINELESSAETVFENIIHRGTIEKQDITRLKDLQYSLDYICENARSKSYYKEVSFYVDGWYKYSSIITIDKNWKKTQFDCYSFERGVLQLEGANCAVLLENAKGPIMENDDFDGIYDIEKKYHIINSQKDAFIVAKGLETGYTLYVIKPSATKLSSSSSTESQVPETHSASTSTQISDKAIMLIYLIVFSLTFLFLLVSFIAEKKKSMLIFAVFALIGSILSGWAYLICTV